MADVNTVAESSTAQIPALGSSLTPAIKAAWNKGEEPKTEPEVKPVPESAPEPEEDSSATDASADEGESAEVETSPAPEAEKPKQAPPKRDNAETRKAQLNAEIRDLLKQRDALKAEVSQPKQTESAPVKTEPQYTRPKPTTYDKDEKGNPRYATYEDYVEDLADWKAEQRIAQAERTRAEQAQRQALSEKISEAKGRYQNFDEAVKPAYQAIVMDREVPDVVKAMLNDSDVLPDFFYTVGSKPEELESFVKMAKSNPGKALRYIALTESLIHEELEGPKETAEAKPPVKPAEPKTKAPKPPSEIGGRGATPPDAEEAAVQANDFRKAKAEWNRRMLTKLKG